MTEALKPCPFCGNDGDSEEVFRDLEVVQEHGQWMPWFHVVCCQSDCHARGPARRTTTAAITAWNTRVSDGAECGLRDALAKILPTRVEDGPDYAEVYFSDGTAHSTRAMTMNPQDWRDIAAGSVGGLASDRSGNQPG